MEALVEDWSREYVLGTACHSISQQFCQKRLDYQVEKMATDEEEILVYTGI